MTAEIAVLNRSAVALAADSAVTVEFGNSAKVYNNANKLFTLSKHHPVGIMFYGSASFMSVPWETIIKEFRENSGHKNYTKIEGFANAFVKFLTQFVSVNDNHEKQNVFQIFLTQFDELNKLIHRALIEERANRPLDDGEVRKIIRNVIRDELNKIKSHSDAPSMVNIDPSDALQKYVDEYRMARNRQLRGRSLTAAAEKSLKEYSGFLLKKLWFSPVSSGIVVSGFGSKSMFPSLLEYKTDGVIAGELKLEKVNSIDIARDQRSAINAFAQGEMVEQFMEGSDSSYRKYFENTVSEFVRTITEEIIIRYSAGANAQKKRRAGQVKRTTEKMLQNLLSQAGDVRHRFYIRPVIQSIDVLPKEELANLAEALVNLTSLKRRVSFEIETVGGDIDVAVISKGDGFIWIKRKHYFDPSLNPHYLSNYFGEKSRRRAGS